MKADDGLSRAVLIRVGAILCLLCGMHVVSGCVPGPGLAIVTLETGKTIFVPSGGYPELVAAIDEENGTFWTLEWGKRRSWLQKRDFCGHVVQRDRLSLVLEFWVFRRAYAVSPDGELIAFFSDSTKGMHLYDVRTGTESVLVPNAGRQPFDVYLTAWLSRSELLLVLGEVRSLQRERAQILTVSVPDGAVRRICPGGGGLFFATALSPDRRSLAYVDETDVFYRCVQILDTESFTLTKTIPGGDRHIIGGLCWSDDSRAIVYCDNSTVKVFRLHEAEGRSVVEIPKGFDGWPIGVTATNKLLYSLSRRSETEHINMSADRLVKLCDMDRGEDITEFDLHMSGEAYLVDGGRRLIAEVAY